MKKKRFFLFFLFFVFSTSSPFSFGVLDKEVSELLEKLKKRGVSEGFLNSTFYDPRFGIDQEIERILKNKKRKNGYDFIFTEESVNRGKNFLLGYKPIRGAREKFGIPEEIIVSILRIETDLGLFLGLHNAPNAYLTICLKSGSLKRRMASLKEFSIFLKYCAEKKVDPFLIKSSWAGAIGLPQFMPSSFVYGIDADGDGTVNLFSFTDAAWSIANYLHMAGWKKGREEKTLFFYNRSKSYVSAVIRYAKLISK